MRFYTPDEFQPLLDLWGVVDPAFTVRGPFPNLANRGFVSAQALLIGLQPWEECLLVVGEHEIWSSNRHLCYRLRQSYGEHRLIREANGHLFLAHEEADLGTFMEVAINAGWDFTVATNLAYSRLFVSHDESFELAFSTIEMRDDWIKVACARQILLTDPAG